MWANAFENKYQRIPGATWFLNNGQPAFDRASKNPGYVKVGSNLDNYKKLENIIKSGKDTSPNVYYLLSSYVSPPLPNSKSQNWAFTNPQEVKKYGLTPPEKDDVYTSAKSAMDSMNKNLNASGLLSMNKMSYDSLSKALPTIESSYNKIPNIVTALTNSVPQLVTTAKTAKQKIKKPDTIFPPEQEKNVEFLFKYMS
jgi:ABC-type glycerol-3-phosphate transport system substrate-binding protein